MLVDAIGQQAALVEADIAGVGLPAGARPCDAPYIPTCRSAAVRRRASLRAAWRLRSCRRPSGPRRRSSRSACSARAGRTGKLDGRGQRLDGEILAVDHRAQFLLEVGEHLLVILRDGLRRNAGHGGDRRLDLLFGDELATLADRQQHLCGTGLVDHVDRLVGSFRSEMYGPKAPRQT